MAQSGYVQLVIPTHTLQKLHQTQQTHLAFEGQQHCAHYFMEHFSWSQTFTTLIFLGE